MKAMCGVIRYGSVPAPLYRTWNNKFPGEKVCFESDRYLLHFDGILLNTEALEAALCCRGNLEILLALYEAHGPELVLHAKGLYSLVLWDKAAGKVLITNDLLSKRPLFYSLSSGMLCYGSSYHDLLDILSRECHAFTLRADAVADMLQRGFVDQSKTYLENVFYLNAFESLLVDLTVGSAELIRHCLKTVPVPQNTQEAIDRFEALFSAAVQAQCAKNAACGYAQCTTLSGGMDSRASLLTAVKLGFRENMLCFNYAQSGSLDYSISQQIAADLGLDYVFYPMDAAVFLGRLQEATDLNECMQSGIGPTGARTMATILDTSRFGIINIGICGGELMGDLIQPRNHSEPRNQLLAMAARFCHKLAQPSTNPDDYCFELQEYLCHLRASQNFAHMFMDKCDCLSPFMDEDVVSFVLQLNPALLYNRRFYRRWMMQYLPNPYIITSTCTTIDGSVLRELFAKLHYRVFSRKNGVSRWNMNPIDHWFAVNPAHGEHCTREFEQLCRELARFDDCAQLLALCQKSWDGPWIHRLYTLTALQGIKDVLSRFYKT